MLNKRGLDRFKKAQAAEPFSVNAASHQPDLSYQRPTLVQPDIRQHSQHGFGAPKVPPSAAAPSPLLSGSNGGGASSWQPPEWAVEPQPGTLWLDVVKDGVVLEKIPLEKRRVIFGRQAVMCDYILDHPSVSRQHAAVVQHKNGSIYVIDLGSVHGTFVSNERLTKELPVELELGQSLRFAASTRSYVLRKASPPIQEAVHAPPVSDEDPESPRLKKPRTGKRVTFRDDYGGLLVEVVGISDGADVSTEPGPIGVKEGSLVGKYESLVQVTVIPKKHDGKDKKSLADSTVSSNLGTSSQVSSLQGVTERLKVYLDKVKSPAKGGLYGDLAGEALAEIKEGSWAENNGMDMESEQLFKNGALHGSQGTELVKSQDGLPAAAFPANIEGASCQPLLVVTRGEDLFTESR